MPELDAYVKLTVNEFETYEIFPFCDGDDGVRTGMNILNVKFSFKIRTYQVMDHLQFHSRAITSFTSFLIVLRRKKALKIKTLPLSEIWLNFKMQIRKLKQNTNLLLILTLC